MKMTAFSLPTLLVLCSSASVYFWAWEPAVTELRKIGDCFPSRDSVCSGPFLYLQSTPTKQLQHHPDRQAAVAPSACLSWRSTSVDRHLPCWEERQGQHPGSQQSAPSASCGAIAKSAIALSSAKTTEQFTVLPGTPLHRGHSLKEELPKEPVEQRKSFVK